MGAKTGLNAQFYALEIDKLLKITEISCSKITLEIKNTQKKDFSLFEFYFYNLLILNT